MSDQLMHYGVKGMRKGARKSREQRNAERRAKYEAKLKAKYGDHDIATIEAFIKKRKAQAKAARDWRLGNQRNRQLTATERREVLQRTRHRPARQDLRNRCNSRRSRS